MAKVEPGQEGFVEQVRAQWNARKYADPIRIFVIEYWGDGDPAFGGFADDRCLGINGEILDRQQRWETEPAAFGSIEQAHEACKAISNRRKNSLLGIACDWR